MRDLLFHRSNFDMPIREGGMKLRQPPYNVMQWVLSNRVDSPLKLQDVRLSQACSLENGAMCDVVQFKLIREVYKVTTPTNSLLVDPSAVLFAGNIYWQIDKMILPDKTVYSFSNELVWLKPFSMLRSFPLEEGTWKHFVEMALWFRWFVYQKHLFPPSTVHTHEWTALGPVVKWCDENHGKRHL